MADPKLRIAELDFETIKANLKSYFQGRPEFTDYDFDGASLNLLLEVLAYNTHYGSYYDNVVANESRLGSAVLRNSIVSRVKEMGYVPLSTKAASAFVNLKLTPGDNSVVYNTIPNVTVERGTIFTTNLNNKSYEFVVLEDFVLEKQLDGTYQNPIDPETNEPVPLKLYEGTLLSMQYVVDLTQASRYKIPNLGCDTGSLRVFVQNSLTDGIRNQFQPSWTFSNIGPENKAYWIWEVDDLLYEVEFGDGVIGKKLYNDNVVQIEYLKTNGTEGNGASVFTLAGSIEGLTNCEVTTVSRAYGGASFESNDSIKFNAPRAKQSQNRAVTEPDYEYIIQREYPAAESIVVWGGEKNEPPQYGKVFASIKLQSNEFLTAVEKLDIQEKIKKYNVVTIIPDLVDPEYTYLLLTSYVTYDKSSTVKTAGQLQVIVQDVIDEFNNTNVGKFGNSYYHSQLSKKINDSDPSIISNRTEVTLQKQFNPILGVPASYNIKFRDAIIKESVYMDGFTVAEVVTFNDATYKMVDDGKGVLKIYRVRPNLEDFFITNIGTVDYETGEISIEDFNPITVSDVDVNNNYVLKVKASPVDEDVATAQNVILEILERTVVVQKANIGSA